MRSLVVSLLSALLGALLASGAALPAAAAPPAAAPPHDEEPMGTPMQPIGPDGESQQSVGDPGAPPPQVQLVKQTLAFTVTLYNLLARDPGNVVFSPFDLGRAMAVLHAGAQSATLMEIRKVMQWAMDNEDLASAFHDVETDLGGSGGLHLRDAVLGAKFNLPESFHVEFLDKHANAARWLKDQTNQRMDFSDPFKQPATSVVSSLALASKWSDGRRHVNSKRHYRARSGEMLNIKTLTDDARLRYYETPQFKMVELKYEGDRFGLVIWLPRDDSVSLKTSPTADELHDMIAQLAPTRVQIALPVFSISSTFRLRKPLNELGLAVALGQNASFEEWGGASKNLCVHDIVHRASIEVDEKTTNAEAATVVKLQGNEIKLKTPKAGKLMDKPFLFMVRDTIWGMPLLYGRVEAAL